MPKLVLPKCKKKSCAPEIARMYGFFNPIDQKEREKMNVVMTGGAFDLLHLGHVRMLQQAKSHGDYLVVNVLSDERIQAKKGDTRGPIRPAVERMEMLMALDCVDDVMCFFGDPEYPVIKALDLIKPNVLVLNSDEFSDFSKEEAKCAELGTKIVYIPRIRVSLDTTGLITKIVASFGK